MSGSVQIKLNHAALRRLDQAAARALEQTGNELLKQIKKAQVMPLDTGNLQNENTFVDTSHSAEGHVELVSSTPYARRLYYHPEYNFHQAPWTDKDGKEHNRANPNAGAHWFEPWADGGEHEDFAQKAFERFFREEAGSDLS